MATPFEDLEQRIVECRHCPRLVAWREEIGRIKVARFRTQEYWARPVPAFGDVQGRLLIVGLAPAAHGGNRTGRVFTGDRSGDWLFEALHRYGFANQPTSVSRNDGLRLTDCLIAAAVRCAPPDNRPTPEEFRTCRPYLEQEAGMMDRLKVVLALGQLGYQIAWQILGEGRLPAFRHGGEVVMPKGRTLLASYHPSQQNTQTGRLTRPMWHQVFESARYLLDAT